MTLHYTTLTYTTLHSTTLTTTTTATATTTTFHYDTNYITLHSTPLRSSPLHSTTLTTTTATAATTLLYTTLRKTTLHYLTLQCTTLTTPPQVQLQLHHANYTTLHHNYNSATLQLQLQLRYTTVHPAVVGEVTTATTATTPKNTTPTTFWSISGFALPSKIHNKQPFIGFLFWNFRHRHVRYYWYHMNYTSIYQYYTLPFGMCGDLTWSSSKCPSRADLGPAAWSNHWASWASTPPASLEKSGQCSSRPRSMGQLAIVHHCSRLFRCHCQCVRMVSNNLDLYRMVQCSASKPVGSRSA